MGHLLLVTIQVDMHDRLALTLQDDLTMRITETGARGVLIDISSLEIVDSFIGRMLANIAGVARVLDAETVVVGMQPAVAITLVELGLSLPGVRTALNVEKGMAMLRASLGPANLLGDDGAPDESVEEYEDDGMHADEPIDGRTAGVPSVSRVHAGPQT
jgi:rsbT antagonist protein RsbS